MKAILTTTLILFMVTLACFGQSSVGNTAFTSESIAKEIFTYKPVQRAGVTDQKFQYALRILDDTRSAGKGKLESLNVANYWNITTAFVILKESKSNIETAFKKAISLDSTAICSYVKALGTSGLEKIIPETFLPFYAVCAQKPSAGDSDLDVAKYAAANKLDPDLTALVNTIYLTDQQFRMTQPVDWARQKPLDVKNQLLIDSLFSVYKTYIGRSMVGKQRETAMWAVVQHSTLEMMDKYLPVIFDAVRQGQLGEAPLKMLIDRIYWLKSGYQIFGSQAGVQLADEKTRTEISKKYNLN